jgi:hypothetical protein
MPKLTKEQKSSVFGALHLNQRLESCKILRILKLVLNHMFTKNLRFFGQTLHLQWPRQTSKKHEKWLQELEGLILTFHVPP